MPRLSVAFEKKIPRRVRCPNTMVGYYPQLQEGELLYSATARLASAIFPGRKAPYCAERLLGNRHASFGVLLPNNVNRLIENIPAVSALTEESVLRASLFHLISPLLDEVERTELRRSVFVPNARNGLRTFNARGSPTVLKYCVKCAQIDADRRKPAIWRTVQNHHGAIACAKHGLLLQFSKAPVSTDALCAASDWIDLGVEPTVATDAEVAIARDFEWIHAQYSSLTPGFRPVVAKLREVILSKMEFTLGPGLANNASLLQAMRDSLSDSSRSTFAPQFRRLARGCGLSMGTRTTLHAYCLYAYMAGTSLKQVLADLAKIPALPKSEAADSKSANGPHIRFYKHRIEKFIQANSFSTRSQVSAALCHGVEIVRSADPEWFDHNMPESQSNKPGPHGDRNWNNRDEKLCAFISNFVATNDSLPFRSIRDALIKLKQPQGLLIKANGRLPKTRVLLESLIEPKRAAA